MEQHDRRRQGAIICFSFFLTLAILVVFPLCSAYAAPALVKNVGTASSSANTTTLVVTVPAAGVAQGNFLVVTYATTHTAATISCADSRSNTWTKDIDKTGTAIRTIVYSAPVTTALVNGDTITVTLSVSSRHRAMSVNEFSGVDSTSYKVDKTSTASGSSASPSSGATSTTEYANELLIGAIAMAGTSADVFTKGSGWDALLTEAGTASITINSEYRVTTSHGAYTADGTNNNIRQWAAGIVTYRQSCSTDFSYKRKITFQSSQVVGGSDFTNFVGFISESGNWLKTTTNDASNGRITTNSGYDIIFRDSDGKTGLDYEIEKYDGTNGYLVAWVKVPTLSASSNTDIYMFYGNSCVTPTRPSVNNVWGSNYKGVWHLTEGDSSGSASGTADLYDDSTSNANHGDDYVSSNDLTGFTATGNGQGFDHSDDYINVPHSTSLEFDTDYKFTVSAWIYPTGWPAAVTDNCRFHYIFSDETNPGQSTPNATFSLRIGGDGTDALKQKLGLGFGYYYVDPEPVPVDDTGYWVDNYYSDADLSLSTWQHVAVTFDKSSTGSEFKFYINGVLNVTRSCPTGSCDLDNPSNAWTIGAATGSLTGECGKRLFQGNIDELRVNDDALTGDWIKTEYNNQSSPATFYSWDTEASASPTAIYLNDFTVTAYEDQVYAEWKTGYEADNLGYHLYREENGQLIRVTPEIITGSALIAGPRIATSGHSYALVDPSAPSPQKSANQKYYLEELDLSGKRTLHGPVIPIVSTEPPPKKAQPSPLSQVAKGQAEGDEKTANKLEALQNRLQKDPSSDTQQEAVKPKDQPSPQTSKPVRVERLAPPEVQWILAGHRAVKIFIQEEGWYRVTQPDLVAAGLSPNVNPNYLRLFVDGQEQAIVVKAQKADRFDSMDSIEFYGVGLDTSSTHDHVYWLVEGHKPGKRVLPADKALKGLPGDASFPFTVEQKPRMIYFAALKNGDEDNFFGPVVSMGAATQTLRVVQPDPAPPGEAILEVSLQGVVAGPHQVEIYLNEYKAGTVTFEGQARGLMKTHIFQGVLREGENLVTLVAQAGETDISMIDYVRLTYWRAYTAEGDTLRCTATGRKTLSVKGFSNSKIRVMDITNPQEVTELRGEVQPQGKTFTIQVEMPGVGQRSLLAFTDDRAAKPPAIETNQPSSWHRKEKGADLVIISHRLFFESLKPLKALREAQGLSVAMIDVEDLYDEFSFGAKDPGALKDFLKRAQADWQKPPRFVLLVGDASFDPRNYLGLGNYDLVPTKMVGTVYLETASDDWFVDFNGDGLPEMAMGRLPVRTPQEAAIVVSKIVGYEQSAKQMGGVSLVSDMYDGEFDFEAASRNVKALLPNGMLITEIYRAQFADDEQFRNVLLGNLNKGPMLVNYFGHGSVELWRGGVFNSSDAANLTNSPNLPFFVNMTCLNGFFHDLYSESLAESLLKAPRGGALAVWTSSSLTQPAGQAVMNQELIRLLFNGESTTIGEAVAKAKAVVNDQDVRKTWILFGDPTTRLKMN